MLLKTDKDHLSSRRNKDTTAALSRINAFLVKHRNNSESPIRIITAFKIFYKWKNVIPPSVVLFSIFPIFNSCFRINQWLI